MKISVIVPIYNCAQYLCACLDSILTQTYRDLEVIVIDDGSSDGSWDICMAYAAADPRIRAIRQANQGVSAARNAGLDIASGQLIAFVDADDAIEPDMYESLLNLMVRHRADIAHCGYARIRFDGSRKNVLGTGILLEQTSLQANESLLSGKHFTGSTWNKLYKSSLFQDLRFDTTMKVNEDVLINTLVFQRAQKLVFWDVPKYHYYERAGSATRVADPITARQILLTAGEKMLAIHEGSPLAHICAQKIHYALLDLYRAYLIEDRSGYRQERRRLDEKMRALTQSYPIDSSRGRWNYRFMRYFPRLYLLVYWVFNKLRTPNYDIQ